MTLLDRYLSCKELPIAKLQLLGCACFLVATKTIGPATYQMPLLLHVTDGTCSPTEIRVSRRPVAMAHERGGVCFFLLTCHRCP